ncbi:putative quinol monooxygenase [Arcobacter roscoffensis]|uniref:Antibiotic biosynthesis monooxygenase n=1 Tax=Arcobacter roscoffensis TaxID=2961520 RepID=A0ABY5E7V5_9BACT|nr:putative quinol monooxygenase [Arcobacter roscoffensis]UTJ07845.1 antibiotic biosynthesis monooxygenase [Arcobacter roscoffensis]
MEKIVVLAKLRIKKKFANEVYNELISLHNNTKKFDEGCIQYDLHKNPDEENSFVFVETWESLTALTKHEKKEHFVSFIESVEGKLESLDISKLIKIDIKNKD